MKKHTGSLSAIVTVLTMIGIAGVIPCGAGTYDAGYHCVDGARFAQNIILSEWKLGYPDRGFDFIQTPFSDMPIDIRLWQIKTSDTASSNTPSMAVDQCAAVDCISASTQDDLYFEDATLCAEGPVSVGQRPRAMLFLGTILICLASLGRRFSSQNIRTRLWPSPPLLHPAGLPERRPV